MTLRSSTSLATFTDGLKCAESISLKQIQWTGGSQLQWCILASALSLCGRQSLFVLYTAGYILCILSVAVWDETVTAKQPHYYSLLQTVSFARAVHLDISLSTEYNMRKPQTDCWACCIELNERRTKCHLGVSSLSDMVLLFRPAPCCILSI